MRILSQSSSLFGDRSMTLPPSIVTLTASKMPSASGSIMSRINSLTDTTGFKSPHSSARGAATGGVLDDDDEQEDANAMKTMSRAYMVERASRGVAAIALRPALGNRQ